MTRTGARSKKKAPVSQAPMAQAGPMSSTTRQRMYKPHLNASSLALTVLGLMGCSGESLEPLGAGGADGPNTSALDGSGRAASTTTGGSTGAESGGSSNSGSGGGATGGTGGGSAKEECVGIAGILTEVEFNTLFPNRNAAYTYKGMVDAAEGAGDLVGFPLFAAEGDCDTRKRELAAFLANVARETGQLVYIEQINKSSSYCDQTKTYGCPAGALKYYGRGPIQLSWNYNYRAASLYLFGDDRLLQNPDLVAEDSATAWATGFWFWMLGGAGGDGSSSPHQAMVDDEGLGATIRIINGGEECNGGSQPYAQEAVSQRVCFYKKYAQALDVSLGDGNLDCGTTTSDVHCSGI